MCFGAQTESAHVGSLVSAAVDDDGRAALKRLMAQDRRQIPTGLSNQVAAQFQCNSCGAGAFDLQREFLADRAQVEFFFPRSVRNPEAAAKIQKLRSDPQRVSRLQREIHRTTNVFGDVLRRQHLRSGKHMKADHVDVAQELAAFRHVIQQEPKPRITASGAHRMRTEVGTQTQDRSIRQLGTRQPL